MSEYIGKLETGHGPVRFTLDDHSVLTVDDLANEITDVLLECSASDMRPHETATRIANYLDEQGWLADADDDDFDGGNWGPRSDAEMEASRVAAADAIRRDLGMSIPIDRVKTRAQELSIEEIEKLERNFEREFERVMGAGREKFYRQVFGAETGRTSMVDNPNIATGAELDRLAELLTERVCRQPGEPDADLRARLQAEVSEQQAAAKKRYAWSADELPEPARSNAKRALGVGATVSVDDRGRAAVVSCAAVDCGICSRCRAYKGER